MFGRCPSCRKLFQAKEIKREEIAGYSVQEPTRYGFKNEHVRAIRVYFKCKNCSHEWTDMVERNM